MPRDEQEIVSELRCGLIQRIGQERFDLWFGSNACIQPGANQIQVRAGSQFVLDRLRKQFIPDLEAVGHEVLGGAPRLIFSVDSSSTSEEPVFSDAVHDPAQPAQDEPARAPSSNRRMRFRSLSDFVVGSGNRIAYSAASTVTERLGTVSPLFLYGPTGCGKTHLLQGIWSAVRQQANLGRPLFLSAEQFTTHFLEALRGGGLPSFRRKCRDVQLLAIDDVQFFSGKRATMIELQHTVDELQRRGRQLVLTADRPPALLSALGGELITRVSGGLVCGIDAADYTTRLGIADQVAARLDVPIPRQVVELIAAEMGGDARQIAGALNRLQATSEAFQRPVTPELAHAALQDLFRATQRVVRLVDIEQVVCDVFGLEPKRLRDTSKARSVTQPRMLAMWLARKYTRAPFTEISQYFGRRSHSTVISAEQKVNRWVAEGASIQCGHSACNVQDAIRRIETQLRTG